MNCKIKYPSILPSGRWGNTSLHEAHTGGDRNMIKMLEVAKASQLPELSDNIHETQGILCLVKTI